MNQIAYPYIYVKKKISDKFWSLLRPHLRSSPRTWRHHVRERRISPCQMQKNLNRMFRQPQARELRDLFFWFTPLESAASCPVRSLASIEACSGDENKFLLKGTPLEIYLKTGRTRGLTLRASRPSRGDNFFSRGLQNLASKTPASRRGSIF